MLKNRGRIAVVSPFKEGRTTRAMRPYERVHERWPESVDCRPIYAETSMTGRGYIAASRSSATMAGPPLDIILATKPDYTSLRQV